MPDQRNLTVAREGRQNVLMTDILRERLVFLGSPASLLTEPSQHFSKSVRIAVRKVGRGEGVAEYLPDSCRVSPSFSIQSDHGKLMILIKRHPRRRKQRIVRTPKALALQITDPILEDRKRISADWNEVGREALRIFGSNLPSVLTDATCFEVNMPKAQRGKRVGSRCPGLGS